MKTNNRTNSQTIRIRPSAFSGTARGGQAHSHANSHSMIPPRSWKLSKGMTLTEVIIALGLVAAFMAMVMASLMTATRTQDASAAVTELSARQAWYLNAMTDELQTAKVNSTPGLWVSPWQVDAPLITYQLPINFQTVGTTTTIQWGYKDVNGTNQAGFTSNLVFTSRTYLIEGWQGRWVWIWGGNRYEYIGTDDDVNKNGFMWDWFYIGNIDRVVRNSAGVEQYRARICSDYVMGDFDTFGPYYDPPFLTYTYDSGGNEVQTGLPTHVAVASRFVRVKDQKTAVVVKETRKIELANPQN